MELLEQLAQLTKKLESEKIDYALCGGLAMAVYAFPRATLDIDIMIEPRDLGRAKEAVKTLGFDIDAGLSEFHGGRIQIYRMTKFIPDSPDPMVLEKMLVTPDIQEVWVTRRVVEWEEGEIAVVSPEGLIALKTLRGSGQDRDDIAALRGILDED